jgi:phosphinothricin acetyltransferase
MVVRSADPARDAAACAAIYAPYVTDGVASFEAEPPSASEMAQRIDAITRTHPWLVYEAGGAILGYAYGSQHRTRAAYRWAADVTVYVDAGHRRALYEELIERLRRQGFRTLHGGITLPNDASVGLHEALGFRLIGVYRNVGWKAGRWWHVGWWQLDLGDPGKNPPPEPEPPS